VLSEVIKKVTKYSVNVLKVMKVVQSSKMSRPLCNSKVFFFLFSQLTGMSSEPGTSRSQTLDGFLNLLLFRRSQNYFYA